mgnify:CR=1 FL=1
MAAMKAADSTTQQGSTDVASPSIFEEVAVTIALTEEESAMHDELGRLLAVYFLGRGIYHIVMDRPD